MASQIPKISERWYYPKEIENDLKDIDLSENFIAQTLTCAWEYTRSIIPYFTNWDRDIAFIRLMVIAVVTDFRGDLVDVAESDILLGYNVKDLFDILFGGTAGHEEVGC